METKISRKAALEAFISLYDFHTKLFHNVLDSISEEDALQRLNTKANHMSWLAGSLVQERFALASLIGKSDLRQTSDALFKDHQGIKDGASYPPLAEYKKDWDQVSPALKDILTGLTEEQLEGPDPFEMPGGDYTLFDTVTFCTDRESYCIGQLGLWRRLLGYEAMKYD